MPLKSHGETWAVAEVGQVVTAPMQESSPISRRRIGSQGQEPVNELVIGQAHMPRWVLAMGTQFQLGVVPRCEYIRAKVWPTQ